jgi:hypothetical protein
MKHILALLLALACLHAGAAEVAGMQVPELTRVGGQTLLLNGAGLRIKYAFARVYVGALYLPQKTHDAGAVINAGTARCVVMTMLRTVAADTLYGSLVEGMAANTPAAGMQALVLHMAQAKAIFQAVGKLHEGDVVTLDFVPGQGTLITVKGRPYPLIEGDGFARALLGIWLGPHPVQDDLKRALLGE